jgi:hypothetical protein
VIATVTYDGRPQIAGACARRSSFTVTRDEGARTTWLGVEAPDRRLVWADARTFTVAAQPALSAGQTVSVITTRDDGALAVISRRDVRVGECRRVPPPARVPPTNAELRAALRRGVRAAGAELRRARLGRRVTVPFAFIEPGSVRLELTAGGKVVGSGVETVARSGRGRVTIAFSRRPRGRLMLTGTFVPARPGVKPQTARARVRP